MRIAFGRLAAARNVVLDPCFDRSLDRRRYQQIVLDLFSSSCSLAAETRLPACIAQVSLPPSDQLARETSITLRPPTFRHLNSRVLHITLPFPHLSLPS
jgi:hypothetical protein